MEGREQGRYNGGVTPQSLTLRRRAHLELFASARTDGRLSRTNRIVVAAILVSVVLAIIATEQQVMAQSRTVLRWAEFGFGLFFLVEYCARLWAAAEQPGEASATAKRLKWARSFFAIIDLAVVIASLMPFLVTGAPIFRLVRLFRLASLLRFGEFSMALRALSQAIADRRYDLAVTGALAGSLVLVGATALYWAEGSTQPEDFGSIPRAMWWSIITLTTVGYGDVSPVTVLGKIFAAVVALGGIGLVAMPTGIIAAAFSDAMQKRREERRPR
ncbi:MAG: ion transporter [Erythrobacter sp.]|nr:ion transporter [Erythrobacter sp.]